MDKPFLNYESYTSLVEAIASGKNPNAERHAQLITKAVAAFNGYVTEVCASTNKIKFAYLYDEGEALREAVQNADAQRSSAHNSAIAMVTPLNRLAALYGLPDIFVGDVSDRIQVAGFCMEMTGEIFRHRKL